MHGESCKIKEPKGLEFSNEVHEAAASSVWTEPRGKVVIR